MPQRLPKAVVLVLSLGMAGCAASNPGATAALTSPAGSASGLDGANASYVLSAQELDLDCKQLTGRMQIRILEIRDYNERSRTTMVSRALQSGAITVFGGPTKGLDPSGAYAKDRAMLDAYNHQLLAKNCRTYDLESELTPQDVRATPNASIKPAKAN